MASVEEVYSKLGVIHSDDCNICKDIVASKKVNKIRRRRLWKQS